MEHVLSLGKTPKTTLTNISLIGFMGCGKTTVGQALANKMGYLFKDMDGAIEERAGQPIPEIFRQKGEQDFRVLEKSVLSEIRQDKKTVIACGGGAVLDRDNRDILSRNSLVIWLYSSLESCLQRIGPKSRPLLDSSEREENVPTLFQTRIPYYAQTADLVVWNNKNPEKPSQAASHGPHSTRCTRGLCQPSDEQEALWLGAFARMRRGRWLALAAKNPFEDRPGRVHATADRRATKLSLCALCRP